MFKFTNALFITLLAFACSKMTKQITCRGMADDCDPTHLCCGDFVCKNFRCVTAYDEVEEIEFSPKGLKCDLTHRCPDFFYCESHMCKLHKAQLEKYLKKLEEMAKSSAEQQKQQQKLKQ